MARVRHAVLLVGRAMRPFIVTVLGRQAACTAVGYLVAVSTFIASVGPGLGCTACVHMTLVVVLDDGQDNLLVEQAENRDVCTGGALGMRVCGRDAGGCGMAMRCCRMDLATDAAPLPPVAAGCDARGLTAGVLPWFAAVAAEVGVARSTAATPVFIAGVLC